MLATIQSTDENNNVQAGHSFIHIRLLMSLVIMQECIYYIIYVYSDVNELYDHKKFSGLYTLCIINMLVELTHKNKTEKNQELCITGKN